MHENEIVQVTKVETRNQHGSHYRSSSVEIKMPHHDTDVALVMPNGKTIECQYRVEGPTLDICLPENLPVTNWQGEDMEPAPPVVPAHDADYDDRSHERKAQQLCIGLPPVYVDEVLQEKADAAGIPTVAMPVTSERISIMPKLTADQSAKLAKVMERKQHLEYLCYMMLQRLMEAVPLQLLMKKSKQYIGDESEVQETLNEFFGDVSDDEDEEKGSPSVEGHTIDSLLKAWRETTDEMMALMSGRG